MLLTFDEVTTMFHEFGHALHGMLSNVRYPTLSGTQVPRDFVEYPSQYNEMWAREPAVVAHYAHHYQTGAADAGGAAGARCWRRSKFNQGYATTEYLAAALLDQAWHQIRRRRRRRRPTASPPSSRRRSSSSGLDYAAGAAALSLDVLLAHLRERLLGRATTPTCGARCSRATPGSGSTRTAA